MVDPGLKRAQARYKCEKDHLFFTRYFFLARQGIKLRVNWHHVLMADAIERVIRGDIENLILNLPPGGSKTEFVVINLMARGLAINPRARFLHLSGSDQLATLNSSVAREIVQSDKFQELWPLKIADDAKAKKRWNVEIDGQPAGGVYATSIGGQVTGFRAGHMTEGFQGCFVGRTRIWTNRGSIRIDEIRVGDIVISYNHTLKRAEYQPVLATKVSIRRDIAETIFASGVRVRATPCHRFYNGESYTPLSKFKRDQSAWTISRDTLAGMSQMSQSVSAVSRRYSQINGSRSATYILFRHLLIKGRIRLKQIAADTRSAVPYMHAIISSTVSSNKNMFGKMRRPNAFAKNAWIRQLQLSGITQRLFSTFRETQKISHGTRWPPLPYMWLSEIFNSSSRGPHSGPQHYRESGDAVQAMPHSASQITPDSISIHRRVSDEPTAVYDIQVAKNHNFFAEGILAHNCIIIDDPIKTQDTFSRTMLEAANRSLITTVKSRRANPKTPIIVVMQRIAENDPVGFIHGGNLDGKWTTIKIPAVIDEAYINTLDPKYQAMIDRTEFRGGRMSYWSYKEPLETLLAMERGDGADQGGSRISRHVFSSQYMQSPVQLGGNIIKGEYFQRYTVLPKIKWRKIFADTAQKTKEANDFSVFGEYGIGVDNKVYLIDMIRGKWEAPELQKRAIAFWQKCKARDLESMGQMREMQVEDKSSGTGLIQTIRLMNNIPIKPIERVKDKLTRVMDMLPYQEVGSVCIPEAAPFTNDFVAECEAFTADDSHDHDDQIDTLCDAVNDMLSAGNKMKQWEMIGVRG